MRLFFYFIDMAVVNAWLLYRRDAKQTGMLRKNIMLLREFRTNVAEGLCKAGKVVEKRKGRPSMGDEPQKKKRGLAAHQPTAEVRKDSVGH